MQRVAPAACADESGAIIWDSVFTFPLPPVTATIADQPVVIFELRFEQFMACGVAHIDAQPGTTCSDMTWVQVVGAGGARRSDGETLGTAELQVSARVFLGDEWAAEASAHEDAKEHKQPMPPPTSGKARDSHGFVLQGVDARAYAAFRAYYDLVMERQLRFWARIGASCVGVPPMRASELEQSAALGMPPALRPRLWMHFAAAEAIRLNEGADAYAQLLRQRISATGSSTEGSDDTTWRDAHTARLPSLRWLRRLRRLVDARSSVDGSGHGVVASSAVSTALTVEKQIDLDVPRTFPEHAVFASDAGQAQLRRVLVAHARRNPRLGYTQSMNFLAAFLLLQMDEEGAFWMMCALTENLLPEYYTAEMIGVRVDCLVLTDLLARHDALAPVLAALQELDLDLSIVSTQWLLLAFLNTLPTETTLRVWDLFFAVGSRALLASALATLRIVQGPLLAAAGSFDDVYTALKHPQAKSVDSDAFMRVVVEELRGVRPDELQSLREHRRREVLLENAQREKARQRYANERKSKCASPTSPRARLLSRLLLLFSTPARRLALGGTLLTLFLAMAYGASKAFPGGATYPPTAPSRCAFGRSKRLGACRFDVANASRVLKAWRTSRIDPEGAVQRGFSRGVPFESKES